MGSGRDRAGRPRDTYGRKQTVTRHRLWTSERHPRRLRASPAAGVRFASISGAGRPFGDAVCQESTFCSTQNRSSRVRSADYRSPWPGTRLASGSLTSIMLVSAVGVFVRDSRQRLPVQILIKVGAWWPSFGQLEVGSVELSGPADRGKSARPTLKRDCDRWARGRRQHDGRGSRPAF